MDRAPGITNPALHTQQMPSLTATQAPASSANVFSLDQLRDMPIPPQDHTHFDLPSKRETDNLEHELAEEVQGYRSLGPGYDEDGFAAINSLSDERLNVTRETVQKFFQGELPLHEEPGDLQPLALFLVQNNLPNALSWLMAHSGLDTLDLSDCSLGDTGMQTLATWVKTCPVPIKLNVESNGIGPEGVKSLAHALPGSQVTSLMLNDTRIGDDGMRSLCEKLPGARQLQALQLHGVGMGNEGLKALAEALPQSAVQQLSIEDGNSHYDDAGARHLAEGLRNNPGLTQIRLRLPGIGDEGWTQLAQSLKSNTQLCNVIFHAMSGPDPVSDRMFSTTLADSLRGNRTLQSLDLGGIQLSEDGARAINDSVRGHPSLVDLSLP